MNTSLSLFFTVVRLFMIGSGDLVGFVGTRHFIGDIILLGGIRIVVGIMVFSTIVAMIFTIITSIAPIVMLTDRVRFMLPCVLRRRLVEIT